MAITLHTEVADTEIPEQDTLDTGFVRDEFQLQIDKEVADLKHRTATAGWPASDPKKLFLRYVVGKDDKAALKGVIRRAAIIAKVKPVWYKDATTAAGHVAVKFHVARAPLMKDGKHVHDEHGVPQFVKDDSLDANGKPVKAA